MPEQKQNRRNDTEIENNEMNRIIQLSFCVSVCFGAHVHSSQRNREKEMEP